ncbi:zinc metalloproteinase nas-36-like [Trichomycterus rosablanca]|uniref:zinc metalloproteinase nas-36-like n=1 Tax=Trichomycterus rosablanca TaxID=2290929 RepID=UPI002F35A381
MFGDIVMHTGFQNADPCTKTGCKWPKYSDGRVYVPYAIANHYSQTEIATIERALQSFAKSTCIRFVRWSKETDYIYIQSLAGCYSRVGRTGRMQTLSLAQHGCIYHHVIQHELLHALGFVHEHSRSDRDNYVRIHLENVIPGQEHNFDKIQTNNLNTPYDYNSVMQYGGLFFSSNQRPTIIPIPDSSVPIGQATQMSHYDIQRVNNLYFGKSSNKPQKLPQNGGAHSKTLPVMLVWKGIGGLLALLLVCSVRANEQELSVGDLLERANRGIVRGADEPTVIDDIAVDEKTGRNADPCTSSSCMWPKSTDGKVYVPYVIANHFTSSELQVIQRGLDSFSSVTCIRFVPRSNQRDYISIESRSGCYSYVGRTGYAQTVSLDRYGCIYHNTVQHELLHALGFNHEQCRSDRDNHIRVVWENIIDSYKYAFDKIATLNQGTPYDYNSVMQYHRTAFSKNGQPTMVPIPNSNVAFGTATQMSQNDIARVNNLYKC